MLTHDQAREESPYESGFPLDRTGVALLRWRSPPKITDITIRGNYVRGVHERAVLKPIHAALVRASDRWRGIRVSEFERRQLERLRGQLVNDHRLPHSPAVTNESTPTSSPLPPARWFLCEARS